MRNFIRIVAITCILFGGALVLPADCLELVRVYSPQDLSRPVNFRGSPSLENADNILCALPHGFVFTFLDEHIDSSGKIWVQGIADTQDGRYEGWMVAEFTERLSPEKINSGDDDGWTPLTWALLRHNSPDIIIALLQNGADVNIRSKNGDTALMLAAYFDVDLKVIPILLKNGANVNARDSRGNNVLVNCNNPGMIASLVKNGVDIKAVNDEGATALMTALTYKDLRTRITPETVTAFIRNGADPNAADTSGMTALMSAAGWGANPQIISALAKGGANVNAESDTKSVLMWAAHANPNPVIISALLQCGAKINAGNRVKQTALMIAAKNNPNPEIISLLLKNGANAKAEDKWSKKAIDYAKENKALENTKAYWELHDASF